MDQMMDPVFLILYSGKVNLLNGITINPFRILYSILD